MKRKSIAFILAAVLSLSLMGCGAKQEAAQPAAEETTEAAEEAPAAEAPNSCNRDKKNEPSDETIFRVSPRYLN